MVSEGEVYLIHFDSPLAHAKHYIGFAHNVDARLHYHRKGKGANLLNVLNEQGIKYKVVARFPGGKELERYMKSMHGAKIFCPVCSGEKAIDPVAAYRRANTKKAISSLAITDKPF